MVSSYLKYGLLRSFGTVTSNAANVVWLREENPLARNTSLGQAVTAANEEVLCWDVKKGEILGRWRDPDCGFQVTAIAQNKLESAVFAVGYADGSIRLWDSKIPAVLVTLNGHRSAVSALVFDKSGVRLASGSTDTDVIVWDLVAEVGVMKLKGHGDGITGLQFLEPDAVAEEDLVNTDRVSSSAADVCGGFLISSSKDALIKLWDLASRQCLETHIAQTNGECWSLAISPDGSGCITAGNDGEVTFWFINKAGLLSVLNQATTETSVGFLLARGSFQRRSKEKTSGISFHPERKYFAIHGSEKNVEIWRMRTDEEVTKVLARKLKRKREKLMLPAGSPRAVDGDTQVEQTTTEVSQPHVSDLFVSYVVIQTAGKVKSIDWAPDRGSKALKLLVATTNNQLEMYTISSQESKKQLASDTPPDYARACCLDLPGHRTDVRGLALSSDDTMVASVSNGALKIWNTRTGNCIRTLETGYALCCTFLPGDKVVVVGTRSGHLELFDVASSTLLDKSEAHHGAIWALQVHPDGRSLVSGSADKSAKFWNFEVFKEELPGTQMTKSRLRLAHTRTLKVTDDILGLRFSPDARVIAVALLDSTVKVFFVDSLKLSLNLYGHKLPVLSLDISFDSRLIVTCSADKNVRIWGLDFGDCHKALFAHQDSVLQVAFVPSNQDGNGHNFFSCGKDRLIKYWDGDKFEQIQKLDGHYGEIWALAVSRIGQLFVTASHDKSIRIWEQTDEQIFLEEEKEMEMEKLYENTLTTSMVTDLDVTVPATVVQSVSKQTALTLMAGERVAEALEISFLDLKMAQEWEAAANTHTKGAARQRHPLFMALGGVSAESYVLGVLQKIQPAALQDALLILTFAQLPILLTFLDIFAARSMDIPLTCRILFFMLKTHHRQIVAAKSMRAMLHRIEQHLQRILQTEKDGLGHNLAALRVVGMRISGAATSGFGEEQALHDDSRTSMRKRGFVQVA